MTNGLYSVLLGNTTIGASMTAFPSYLFSSQGLRLRVWFDDGVHGSQLLSPDQRLVPAAYLADGSVSNNTIADNAISGSKLGNSSITGAKISTGSLNFNLFNVPAAPGPGQVLGYDGTGLTWTTGGVFQLIGSNAYYIGGDVGIGTDTPASRLHVAGSITYDSMLSKLDVNSAFTAQVRAADFFLGQPARRLDAEYDTCVAGIVSGANGVDTGIILIPPNVNEGGQNVAISGRVYAQADATGGPIKAGDLLTTSKNPGHAMKVTDHTRAQGAVLGKAMSALDEGTGMVLVLVTLQ